MPIDLSGDVRVAPPVLPAVRVAPPAPTTVTVLPVVGPTGPQGIPGDTGVVTLPAGGTLSGHRLVTRQPDGSLAYADNATVAHVHVPLWLTLGAAVSGAQVNVQAAGIVTEPSWSWPPGPLYLGTNGQLTQTVPTSPGAAFSVQVGYATSATSIVLDRQPSLVLI
jgi:hypothetical protein